MVIIYAQGLSRAELGHLHCSDRRVRLQNERRRLLPQARFRPKQRAEIPAAEVSAWSPLPAA